MNDMFYMAWRYLAYHRLKTTILVASITLIVFLPIGLNVLVSQSADALTARAEATPLLVGAKGSPLELVLNSLYFSSDTPETIPISEAERITGTALATAIPVYTRFQARKHPIVGTSLEYFGFRAFEFAQGRPMAMLGECVLGAKAAVALGVGVEEHVLSSPESVFDLAGVYPLKMKIAGILQPTGSPDDEAVFVDMKTAWIIEGRAHGHQDLTQPDAASGVLKRVEGVVVANASVVQYNEITPENVDSFHFHGDPGTFPVTAVIAVPHDAKSGTLLQGRYLGEEERVQVLQPIEVMNELLETVLTVQSYVVTAVLIVGLSTLATAMLVFLLSLRVRKREIDTMHKIGGSRGWVFGILAGEIVVVLLLSVVLAGVLTALTSRYGSEAIRAFIG